MLLVSSRPKLWALEDPLAFLLGALPSQVQGNSREQIQMYCSGLWEHTQNFPSSLNGTSHPQEGQWSDPPDSTRNTLRKSEAVGEDPVVPWDVC